jgi:hypothetical protein
MIKLMDIKGLKVGSIPFQQAMTHNIFAKIKAGERYEDLTDGEPSFLDIQIDHLKGALKGTVDYVSNKCPRGYEEYDDEKYLELKTAIETGEWGDIDKDLTNCMECEHSCIVKSAMEE